MSSNLNNDDRRALDLLLDRTSAVSSSGAAGYASPGVDPARVAGAERVLKLLSLLPAEEPSPNLLEQTLRRIGEAPSQFMPGMTGIAGQQTHA